MHGRHNSRRSEVGGGRSRCASGSTITRTWAAKAARSVAAAGLLAPVFREAFHPDRC